MDLKTEFDKLQKTAAEGFDQARNLAGGLAQKAVEAVQEKVGAVTGKPPVAEPGKTAAADPVRSWNSTVATSLEGKNTMIRVPVEMAEILGWKDKEIVTFSLLADGSVNLKKFVDEAKA
jgi:hypothetical protein